MKGKQTVFVGIFLMVIVLSCLQSYATDGSSAFGVTASTQDIGSELQSPKNGPLQASPASTNMSVLGGMKTAFYGTATNDSIRNLTGYADYVVVSHALYNDGDTIKDNVRYLATHGVKVILDTAWWDVWPFDGAVNGYSELHVEDLAWGMNGTETVKYRIRNCIETIGSEYIWGVTIDEEVGDPSVDVFPWPLIAWYQNLFCDWIHTEYSSIQVLAWPAAPYPEFVSNHLYHIRADGIVYDNYDQNITRMGEIASFLRGAYPEGPIVYLVSAAETISGWYTCHPPTYLKRVILEVSKYVDVVGFWTMTENSLWGWEDDQDPGYQLSLRMCEQIHLNDWNTVYSNTEWFECGFGNDTVTDSLSNWNSTYWYEVSPNPSLEIQLSTDRQIGDYSINLTSMDSGIHSYWWQFGPGHYRSYPDWSGARPYGAYNLSSASRISFWLKGSGWGNHPEATVRIFLEKSNYPAPPGIFGNLTLPEVTTYLLDGAWHLVSIALPLDPSAYYDWDGYASQIRVEIDYDHSIVSDTTSILIDGWFVDSFDTGEALGLNDQGDFIAVDNGTLEIGGSAYFESIFPVTNNWYYQYSGSGSIMMRINGTWTAPPDEGMPCYWNVTGVRLFNGSFDWIKINALPPLVIIVSPKDESLVSGTIIVEVNATDVSGIKRVEYSVDGMLLYTDTSQPYSWDWDTSTHLDGAHRLNVTAYANNDAVNFYHVQVYVDNTKPVTAIMSPLNESRVRDTIQVNVSASDSSGIDQVEFYVEGVLFAIDANAPYSATWNSLTNTDGPVNLTCFARDAAGNVERSMHLLVIDNTDPAASINSVLVGADSVFVSLNASDSSGIDRIEFLLNSSLEYTDYSYPFEWTWITSSYPDGVYAIEALVYDSLGHMNRVDTEVIVDQTPPSLSITLNPSTMIIHELLEITADASDASNITQVEFYIDGGLEYTSLNGPHIMYLDTTLLESGNHTLVVIAIDSYGNTKQVTHVLTIDNNGPELSFVSPLNGTNFEGPTSVFVRITADDIGGISSVILSYSTGGSWSNITMVENGGFYEANLPILGVGTTLSVRVYAYDTFGIPTITALQTYSIVDTIAPTMSIPSIDPAVPTSFDSVTVMLTVTDNSGVDSVVLSYQVDHGIWMNFSMSLNSVYWGTVPAQTTGSIVNYRIYANDTLGQWATSPIFEYTVVSFDVLPPSVISYNWSPIVPSESEQVEVQVNATDPSSVVLVILSYQNGTHWTNVTMSLVSGLFVENIPALPYGTTVTMNLYCCDGQDNWGVTPLGSYIVVSSDLDGPDVLLLTWSPSDPTEEDTVEVYTELSDTSGIQTAILCYGQGTMFANVTMTFNGTGYVAIIGARPIGTSVNLRVYSCDTRDNWVLSPWDMYVVQASDVTPPIITNVEWLPLEPFSNESIHVNATITDANPINLVLLEYFDGVHWRNLTMVQMSSDPTLFVVHIPMLGNAGTIQIWILAQDSKGNWGYTDYMDILIQETPPSTTTPTTTAPTTPTTTAPVSPPDPLIIGVMGALVVGLPAGIVVGLGGSRLLRRKRSGK